MKKSEENGGEASFGLKNLKEKRIVAREKGKFSYS
jgi:hypothetical protein